MGSSLNLRGGSSLQKSLVDNITQSVHGFVVGDVLRYNTSTSKYVKAIADSAENAEVVGIVSEVTDADGFSLTYNGYVDVTSLSGITAPVLFLSGTTAGACTTNPPSAIGTVIKTVLAKNTVGAGYVFVNYLGTQIGGSSTVAIDQIQPVGSIIPYAGGVIPETWLACDGASYAFGDYAELYAKLQYTTGSRVPMYGGVVELAINSEGTGNTLILPFFQAAAVGDIVYINNSGVTPTYLAHDFVGQIVRTGILTNPSQGGFVVQLLPKYNSTTKSFSYPNNIINAASKISLYSSLTATAVKTNGTVATINLSTPTHFNTPDLRGRFAMGVNTTAIGEVETDATNTSAISNIYALGSEGGEEKNSLPTAGAASSTGTNCVANVTNNLLNNMPPYLATQYIIKAKPYTRAAIIDGIDIPYDQLLVRNMKTRVLGGSNSSLELYTNTAGDGGFGTQRMTITTNGLVGIGTATPEARLEISGTNASPHLLLRTPVSSNALPEIQFMEGTAKSWALVGAVATSGGANGTFGIRDDYQSGTPVRLAITNAGRVGIGTVSPSSLLHVSGAGARITITDTTFGTTASFQILAQTNNTTKLFRIYDATSGVDLLDIKPDGNVGIGNVISPLAKLHLKTPALSGATIGDMNLISTYSLFLDATSISGSGTTPVFSSAGIAFGSSSTSVTLPFASIFYGGDGSGGSLHFATSTTYANGLNKINMSMRNGMVGIGTTGPAVALDVVGAIRGTSWANGQVTPAAYIQSFAPTTTSGFPVGTVWYVV